MTVNPLQEDKGLAKIHAVCAEMDAIWRPTISHDLGVDGQVEFIEPGTVTSTGMMLAVQSKSGPSYFEREVDGYFLFEPEGKHRRYWKLLRMPIILVLHNPNRDLTIYADVKSQLRSPGPLRIDKTQLFRPDARAILLSIASSGIDAATPKEILDELKAAVMVEKRVTGIEFLLAMTDSANQYFELRMCRYMLLSDIASKDGRVYTGEDDYEFIQRCTLKCHFHHLMQPFLEEFERSWYDLKMVPDILVPLTPKGKEVIRYLMDHLESYVSSEGLPSSIPIAQAIKNFQEAADFRSAQLDESDRLGEFSM